MLNGERFVLLVCTKIKKADFAYESKIPDNILEANEVGGRSKFALKSRFLFYTFAIYKKLPRSKINLN